MPENVDDVVSYVMGLDVAALIDVEALTKRLTEAAESPDSVLANAVKHINMFEQDMRELAQFRRGELSREPEILVLAKAAIAAALKPARAKTRRPPVQLVVLVLLWLILVVGPLAEGKLPSEIQVMLSTETGTIGLALAITQMMNQKRK